MNKLRNTDSLNSFLSLLTGKQVIKLAITAPHSEYFQHNHTATTTDNKIRKKTKTSHYLSYPWNPL